MSDKNILEIKNLSFSFHTYGGIVKAVRDISFEVKEGEILGIVGESGCGKSVTAQCILKLNPESVGFFESGSMLYEGKELITKSDKEMRKIRGKEIGFIFQDPMTSLNPTMRIGKQIEEIFLGRTGLSHNQIKKETLEILEKVGITDPERRLKQYPHELSGGMRQRIGIAMALVGKPKIIIADEPTTSLDVTIEAQILSLLKSLCKTMNVAVMIITHDLGVIAKICDRVLVMYGGKIMESGSSDDIFYKKAHPYTKGLLQSIARLDMKKEEELIPIEGTPPDLFSPPKGCPFAVRCEHAMEICYEQMPEQTIFSGLHLTYCWLQHPYAPKTEGIYQLNEEEKADDLK
ncbi:ABC transporter ATP-binding protein [Anaerocolumna sp. MB42-C2]|uniref:ABC transporter ATP-binding protein n=1 Tax=Anaerocolumna sp. MB42-C2 TaxID=3070997 RepID=UPI0027E0C67F|nr:ABC transporter ATP-binding protein [Anaerocolumna sp. MB42-C2]WMJ88178.1 ABC transporter ATP-binding protein [Anaerocolumna sp. MB42-C2]